jgi:hypothetical protein
MKERLEELRTLLEDRGRAKLIFSIEERGKYLVEIEEIIGECENIITYSDYIRKCIRLFHTLLMVTRRRKNKKD